MRNTRIWAILAVLGLGCGGGKDPGGGTPVPCTPGVGSCPLAPPLDRTVATTVWEEAKFLFTGPYAMQKDVTAGALDPKRIAVVRGKVTDVGGNPVGGVKMTVIGHDELGWTATRADGVFDMAVNGGGNLVFSYKKDGFIAAQRTLAPRWQHFLNAPEVGLTSLASTVSTVSAGASTQQIAQADKTTDALGTRQPLVLFPSGTNATAELPDGSSQALSTLSVHVTEYPVTTKSKLPSRASKFAPGTLPGSGAVNYTLEFTVDEAEDLGANRVTFDKPVTVYVEDMLGLKAGAPVPVGYYNRGSSKWEASDQGGLVVQIVSATSGQADIDVDGDGKADTGTALSDLSITSDELTELASRYQPGQMLWRTRVSHFSAWDYLFPVTPGGPAIAPSVPPAIRPLDEPSVRGPVLVEKQVTQESFGIAGTPYSLHYQSDRTARFVAGYEFTIPLVPGAVPSGLKQVASFVSVAGEELDDIVDATANATRDVFWDGNDGFGRLMQGKQTAHVSLAYIFDGAITGNSVFGVPGMVLQTTDAVTGAPESVIWQDYEVQVGDFDASGFGLGGLSLDVLHAYDPASQTIFFGDGRERSAQNVALVTKQIAPNADVGTPAGVFAVPDGSLLVTDDHKTDSTASGRIFQIAPDQTVTVIAGPGAAGPAGQQSIGMPEGVVMDSAGNVIYADFSQQAVRTIAPSGSAQTLIGPATDNPLVVASLPGLDGLALGPVGELYLVNGNTVMKLQGGVLSTIAGGGTSDIDNVLATQAVLNFPSGIAVKSDGTVFISERGTAPASLGSPPPAGGHRIREVSPAGIIQTIAGSNTPGFSGDGGPATQAALSGPRGLALAPDGSLYVSDGLNERIRVIAPDGTIETVAGGGTAANADGQLAQQAVLDTPRGLALGPDGSLLVASVVELFRVSPGLPAIGSGDSVIPSTDGLTLYRFDSRGKHQETLDAKTGASLLKFTYDSIGQLASVQDNRLNLQTPTTFARPSAQVVTITAPFAQQTTLNLDGQSRVSTIQDPLAASFDPTLSSRAITLAYDDAQIGLLNSVKDPLGNETKLHYDVLGRVLDATDPTGYQEAFAPAPNASLDTVQVSAGDPSKLSMVSPALKSSYARSQNGNSVLRDIGNPDGTHAQCRDNVTDMPCTAEDGTQSNVLYKEDDFFGAQSLVPQVSFVQTPSGRVLTTTLDRQKTFTDNSNALSVNTWTETSTTNGRTSSSVYSRSTNTEVTTSPMGRTGTTTYDSFGRPTDFVAAGSPAIHWTYDASGHVQSVSRTADGATRTDVFTYNPNTGYVASITNNNNETTSYNLDNMGRLHNVQRPDGASAFWTLDNDDHVTGFTPPGRGIYNFNYDADTDLLVSSTAPSATSGSGAALGPLLGRQDYTYGPQLEPLSTARSDGSRIDSTYATNGQLKNVHLGASNVDLQYSYDSAGKLTGINRTDSTRLDMTFDGPLWLSSNWGGGGVTGKVVAAYDANFWLSSLTVNDASTVNFKYDNDGLLIAASTPTAGTLAVNRAADTGFVSDTAIGTVTTTQSYDGFGELAALGANFQNQAAFSQTITSRDSLGRITGISETLGTSSSTIAYVYDNLGRLTQATRDGSVTQYGYDTSGNRTSVTVDGVQTVSATFDEQDRILTHGTETYTETPTGDLLRKTDGTNALDLKYDELGNLMSATVGAGSKSTQIDYMVDGMGRRIARRVNGSFDRAFLYRDELRPVAEITSNGTFSHFVYTDTDSAPDLIVRTGVPFRVIKDFLGSVRLVVNATTGVIAQRIDYDEFGVVLSDSNPGFQPFGFAGGIYDSATGLVRFGARDYDAESGRWAAKDPIGFRGGMNQFAYCGGDPVNFDDQTGRDEASILRKAWRATETLLRFGEGTTLKRLLGHLARGEGAHVATRAEAERLAAAYSRMKGGAGKIETEAGHVLADGRKGFDHVHALDRNGKRLPGHFWYGGVSGLLLLLDSNDDGQLDYLDIFDLATPLPTNLFHRQKECTSVDDEGCPDMI